MDRDFAQRVGVSELDATVIEQSTSRPHTQRASRLIFNSGFDGIYYRSRYGQDVHNWALFEPFKIDPQHVAPIDLMDVDLQSALMIHGLALVSR
jgi:hypothetical protein